MEANQFYLTQQKETTPLLLWNASQCQSSHQMLSEKEINQLTSQQFKGELGDLALIYHDTGVLAKVLVGTGNQEDNAAIAHALQKLPPGQYSSENPLSHNAKVVWALGQYRFDRYKKVEKKPCQLFIAAEELDDVLAEVNAVFLTRDLINTPANAMGPAELAKSLEQLAKTYHATFEQWIGEDLLTNHYPAIYIVGRGAEAKPRLLSLSWGQSHHPKVVLIGKGVCFDSGGLDIKPADGMRLMKKDMGGAAHVMGLAQWIMDRQLPIALQVFIPAVENAVSAMSYRPGDVLTMRNGLTVEIDNTDAEGRLVLADALAKACETNPDLIIDFATLTGAARVAVGTEIAAMFCNDDQLADEMMTASNKADDPVWRLPLHAPYASMLKSNIADMVNSSPSGYAGAITAALFLQRFLAQPIPWVHFDVMAWNLSSKPGKPEGGEALGLRAVGAFLLNKYFRQHP